MEKSGLDLDFETSPGLDDAGLDRIAKYETQYARDGVLFLKRRTRVPQQSNRDEESAPAVEYTRMEGLGSNMGTSSIKLEDIRSRRRIVNVFGNETVESVFVARRNTIVSRRIEYKPFHESYDSLWESLIFQEGALSGYRGKSGEKVAFKWDGLGRTVRIEDYRKGNTLIDYDDANRIEWIEDPAGNRATETDKGKACLLRFDWQEAEFKKFIEMPDLKLDWKGQPWLHVLYNRFFLSRLDRPELFVSVLKEKPLENQKDLNRLVKMGAKPLAEMLGPDSEWEKGL